MSGQEQKTLAIVGLGLIGASIAEATRKRYPGWKIIGVSSPATIKEAKKIGLIDEGFEGYENSGKALEQCDIGFLCTPIDRIQTQLLNWEASPIALKPDAVVSDVGSTKELICKYGQAAFQSSSAGAFIGSHPMAGSEKTGLKARDALLFENAVWILCPDEAPQHALKSLREFVEGLGAHSIELSPADHDRFVAYSSHLPQALATTLGSFIQHQDKDDAVTRIVEVSGGGLRDMTRLAASSSKVWAPIFENNRNISVILEAFTKELQSFVGILKSAYEDTVSRRSGALGGLNDFQKTFQRANDFRTRLKTAPRKGFSSPTTEILVDLEDKPGALLHALESLKELNILDLEILKVREGEEGVLMMGFRKAAEAEKALELLTASGHKARLR